MRKTILAASMLTALAASPAMAQSGFSLGNDAAAGSAPAQRSISLVDDAPVGKAAGTFMVRLRAIGVLPQTSSSSVSVIGGNITASNQAAPEVDVSYFFTDNIAAELIAASTRHVIKVKNSALGTVDVGSTWVLPPTVTLQYHFMPKERFSPYIGAGVNVSFFYATNPTGPIINKFNLRTGIGPAIQAGFDYNFSSNWFLNVDVKQIFVKTSGDVHTVLGKVHASTWLNPTVVGVGIGYRF